MHRYRLAIFLLSLSANAEMPASMKASIDAAVTRTLADTGGVGVSIAVVMDAAIAYEQAYGDARLKPQTAARTAMRYKIASNSKQIAAAAILLLAADGKLKLDYTVDRYLPGLTRGNEVSLRRLLSHTSGYQDYYPLDYVAPFMTHKIEAQGIADKWARKPLDFDPGTQYQYSNTNYTLIGIIVEKLTGKPMIEFLRARIFQPLGMTSAIDSDSAAWSAQDPVGYSRFALGPWRPAKIEAPGWMYAAGELAMSAHDLALWDISLIKGTLLKPESLRELAAEAKLTSGAGTGYALGLGVSETAGSRKWAHTGGASGFLSSNATFPDKQMAVTVLTNSEAASYRYIARQLENIVTGAAPPAATQAAGENKTEDLQAASSLEVARRVYRDLRQGKLDRGLLDSDCNSYFTRQAIADFKTSLAPLGEPTEFRQLSSLLRGGMTARTYAVTAGRTPLRLSTFFTPAGKIAQYLLTAAPAAQAPSMK